MEKIMKATAVFIIGALAGALGSPVHAQLPTSGTIDSRLGKLEVVKGFPTDATVKKLNPDIQNAGVPDSAAIVVVVGADWATKLTS